MICVMRASTGRVGVLDAPGAAKGTKPWSQSTCQIKAHDAVVVVVVVVAAMVAVVKGGCYTRGTVATQLIEHPAPTLYTNKETKLWPMSHFKVRFRPSASNSLQNVLN